MVAGGDHSAGLELGAAAGMRPYYQESGVTIYHGDCREILPRLQAECVITDPVWPNSSDKLVGAERPYELFAEVAPLFPAVARRAVVQLGCNSDPRFLMPMPASMPFIRTCWLEYVTPSYSGRVLYSGDVAYVFGEPPAPAPGRMVLPGKCLSGKSDRLFIRGTGRNKDKLKDARGHQVRDAGDRIEHPSPRRLQHVKWLVNWYGGDGVIDPFGGSGTTAVACKELGVPCVLIEIEERHCELAAKRLAQGTLEMKEGDALSVA